MLSLLVTRQLKGFTKFQSTIGYIGMMAHKRAAPSYTSLMMEPEKNQLELCCYHGKRCSGFLWDCKNKWHNLFAMPGGNIYHCSV